MWIAIAVPLMLLAVAIAVVPVLWLSVRDHRLEYDGPARSIQSGTQPATIPTSASGRGRMVSCPLCTEALRAIGDSELIDAVRRHAWRTHGIPSERHILESAGSA